MSAPGLTLRPPAIVMGSQRAQVIVADALNFSRAAMREMVRGRYRIEKLRFTLDDAGRGEVLYRLTGGGWEFHFFLISEKLPEEQKTDRNYAPSWDAMGVLCQGEWTAQREAHLRREVPKQRGGFADYDTLIYARGNRSARLFDHVVDSLAAGVQPDAQVLAPVGYILRTTAFIGNGQLGTRPYAGLEPDHPFRRPYHAQFCSGFVLREFVFDLVDHIARARNPNAARLSPAWRRYLGLGNSAATGLSAFVPNHPQLMHTWTQVRERALAQAMHQQVHHTSAPAQQFGDLLDKAILHFGQSTRPDDGVFAPPQVLIDDLRRVRHELNEFLARGSLQGKATSQPWQAMIDWAAPQVHPEVIEILHAIVIELHADIIEACKDDFVANEQQQLAPEMTIAALRKIIEQDYAWALSPAFGPQGAHHFWYRSSAAPRDVRRGVRGRQDRLEHETTLDVLLRVNELHACLSQWQGTDRVAELVLALPALRHITARVQSQAGRHYAELHENWLARDFSPFGSIRFALTFFGMEKFEAARPKSVRGTFMQGAPIAEDLEQGRDGTWPFPLLPAKGEGATPDLELNALPASKPHETLAASASSIDDRTLRTIAPYELARMCQNALQGQGSALGLAYDAASLAMLAQACEMPAVATLVEQAQGGKLTPGESIAPMRGRICHVFDARTKSALLLAPSAFDMAFAGAQSNAGRIGASLVTGAASPWLAAQLALRCARRGCIGWLAWCEPGETANGESGASGLVIAGPEGEGAWFAMRKEGAMASLLSKALQSRGQAEVLDQTLSAFDPQGACETQPGQVQDSAFLLVCIQPQAHQSQTLWRSLAARPEFALRCDAHQFKDRWNLWQQKGITMVRAEFEQLEILGRGILLPQAQEHLVIDPGYNPLTMF